MAVYSVQYNINTNVPYDELVYELSLYSENATGVQVFVLQNTNKQSFMSDYKTQVHKTVDISTGQSLIYIMKICVYRVFSGATFLAEEEISIYSLSDFGVGNSSRDGVWYYETSQVTTKKQDNNVNIYQQYITRKNKGVFESSQHPHGDPKDPFQRSVIESQLQIRANAASSRYTGQSVVYPDQGRTMLCGPAAFTYCLMMDRFDLYKYAILDLWETGKTRLGSLIINAKQNGEGISNNAKKASLTYLENLFEWVEQKDHLGNVVGQVEVQRIPSIDWIFMACLRATSNSKMTYDNIDDKTSAITLGDTITSWFSALGSKKIFDNVSISDSNLQDICDLNKYVDTINHSTHVISMVSAIMLKDGDDSVFFSFKNHWITWESPLKYKVKNNYEAVSLNASGESEIKLDCFTWGHVNSDTFKQDVDLSEFLNCTYGGVVFAKIP
ncbi:hypothetical protein E2X65_23355 [Salmonella enterica]|nr:hypothetical protein [Salmonella enterica]